MSINLKPYHFNNIVDIKDIDLTKTEDFTTVALKDIESIKVVYELKKVIKTQNELSDAFKEKVIIRTKDETGLTKTLIGQPAVARLFFTKTKQQLPAEFYEKLNYDPSKSFSVNPKVMKDYLENLVKNNVDIIRSSDRTIQSFSIKHPCDNIRLLGPNSGLLMASISVELDPLSLYNNIQEISFYTPKTFLDKPKDSKENNLVLQAYHYFKNQEENDLILLQSLEMKQHQFFNGEIELDAKQRKQISSDIENLKNNLNQPKVISATKQVGDNQVNIDIVKINKSIYIQRFNDSQTLKFLPHVRFEDKLTNNPPPQMKYNNLVSELVLINHQPYALHNIRLWNMKVKDPELIKNREVQSLKQPTIQPVYTLNVNQEATVEPQPSVSKTLENEPVKSPSKTTIKLKKQPLPSFEL